jgi:hypothetical protein
VAGAALPVGAANLGDPYPGSAQRPAQTRPIVADPFDPHHLERAQALRPSQEVAISDAGGGHRVVAQGPAEFIGGVRDMKMLVGIDPDGDLWDTGWLGGCHCGPSDVRL